MALNSTVEESGPVEAAEHDVELQREERFSEIFKYAPFGIYVAGMDGRIIHANTAFCRMLGYSEQDLIATYWSDLIHSDDLAACGQMVERLSKGASEFQGAEQRYLRRDGTAVWSRMTVSRVGHAFASTAFFVIYVEDTAERKLAEEALHESENRFRNMADSGPAMMWVSEASSHAQFVNRSLREFAGTIQTEVDSSEWRSLIHLDDAPEYFEVFDRAVREQSPFRAEARLRRADGEWRCLDWTAEPRLSAVGKFLGHVGLCEDITDRKQTAQAAKDSPQFAQSTIDALSSHLCVLDGTGTIVAVNQAWKDFGQANRNVDHDDEGLPQDAEYSGIGSNYLSVCDGSIGPGTDHVAKFAAGIRAVMHGEREEYWAEYPCHSPQKQRWFITRVTRFLSNRLPRIVIAHNDITELKQSEQALQRSEEKFRQFAENIDEVFWILPIASNESRYVSPAYERIWGRSCDSFYQDPISWLESIHPDDRERVNAFFESQVEQEAGESEYRIKTPDGQEKWIRNRAFPVHGEDSKLLRIVGIAEDVTERKRQEAELIRASTNADNANQAKSRFLANMSHELRTPMNGVMGMVQLLMLTELNSDQRQYATVAYASCRTLLALINGILDFSKIEAGKVAIERLYFNVRQSVEDVLDLLRVQASAKGIAIHSRVSSEIPELLRGDALRLGQVLTNLCANAIKFTDRGQINVVAELEREEDSRATVRFTIRDTGIGIRAEQIESLFSAFVQADPSTTRKYGGTGLGLAISKQLVNMMGGTIGVDSHEGAGSTFWFTAVFELAVGDAKQLSSNGEHTRASARPIATLIQRTERILVAEDNATNRDVALAQLRLLGFKGTTVDTGLEAVAALERETYDLVLMDCHMPVMDGFEATGRIRMTYPDLPIIALTASAMAADRDRCLSAGMSDYLSKPVPLERLQQILSKWLPATNLETEPSAVAPPLDLDTSEIRAGAATSVGQPAKFIFNVKALMGRLLGDRQLVRTVIKAFLQDAPLQLNSLRSRIDASDISGIRAQAHILRGASATVAAESLQAVAYAMEQAAVSGQLDRCRQFLPQTIALFDEYKDKVKKDGWYPTHENRG